MKPKARYKILLADDHIVLRDALANLVNTFPEFRVIGIAANGREVIEAFKNGIIPDLIILDLNMPEMDGYDTAAWLKQKYPRVKILVLTMFDSDIPLIRLLQTGVRGFLKKDIHPDELKMALLAIAENGYYYSHNSTGKLASFFEKAHSSKSSVDKAMLNEREIEFLKWCSQDITYKEIAAVMHLTPRAIDGYRDGLFEKLDVKSRVGLAIYAVKNGIATF